MVSGLRSPGCPSILLPFSSQRFPGNSLTRLISPGHLLLRGPKGAHHPLEGLPWETFISLPCKSGLFGSGFQGGALLLGSSQGSMEVSPSHGGPQSSVGTLPSWRGNQLWSSGGCHRESVGLKWSASCSWVFFAPRWPWMDHVQQPHPAKGVPTRG